MWQGKPLESTCGIIYLGIHHEKSIDLKIVSGMCCASRHHRVMYLLAEKEMPMKRSGFSHRIWFGITVLAIFFGGFAFYQIGRSAWEREAQPFLSISSPDKTQ
jgi:hypothetical protein